MLSLLLALVTSALPAGVRCDPSRAAEPSNVIGAGVFPAGSVGGPPSLETVTTILAQVAAVQGIIAESQEQVARRVSAVETVLSKELVALSECACAGSTAGRAESVLSTRCDSSLDCSSRLTGAVCSPRGICVCDDGFWTQDNVSCNRMAGANGACLSDRQCYDGLACYRGKCSCPVAEIGSYQYRLAGGLHCAQGRVEVSYKHRGWGLVCDDYWGEPDATVICRSLGFVSGTPQKKAVKYGTGDHYYLDDMKCNGTETSLVDCPHAPWGSDNCSANEVAGVMCHTQNIPMTN